MRHARGDWVWMRARCELVEQAGEPGMHVIGIAVDITEQKNLAERTVAADIRLRDAIETISEAFVVWDADNRLVLCNSKFQSLHSLPDDAVAAGVPYETIVAAGSQPVVRTQLTGEGRHDKGGLTFEAQLDDGRWLQISERRTKDGGFVSVGTDITRAQAPRGEAAREASSSSSRWSSTCARPSRRWSTRPSSSRCWRRNTARRKRAPRRQITQSRSSSPI